MNTMQESFMKAYDTILERDYGNTVRMSEFTEVRSPSKIIADQEYLLERLKHNASPCETLESLQLEAIFIQGVNIGGWLSDVTRDISAYQAQARPAALYDDFSHRIDAVVELSFRKPITSHDGKENLRQVTIGVDVTVGGAADSILDKLTRCYSDMVKLPFGFSRLDYYAHGQQREVKSPVLRYVVALSIPEVQEIWNSAQSDATSSNHLSVFRPNSPIFLRTRFKILSELRSQNMLYFAMLPEDQSGKIVRTAALQIDAVDECFNAALSDCVRQIAARQVVPSNVFTAKQRYRKSQTDREIIEEYFIEESRRKHRRDGDAFTQMLGEARRLLSALYNTDDKNPLKIMLNARRKVTFQNQSLNIPLVRF